MSNFWFLRYTKNSQKSKNLNNFNALINIDLYYEMGVIIILF